MKKIFSVLLLASCSLFYCGYARGQSGFDITTVKNIQAKRTAGKTSFNTTMSGTAIPVSAAVPLVVFVKGMIDKNTTEKKQALFMLEGAAISQATTFAMKAIINRDRPAVHDHSIIALKNATNGSFPSGHTSAAFETATALTILNHKWYVAVPAYTWASLVGYSRVYLGVHYPTDVIAGAIVGSGSAWLSYKLNKWMHHPKKGAAGKHSGV